jgi:hypothetical protein
MVETYVAEQCVEIISNLSPIGKECIPAAVEIAEVLFTRLRRSPRYNVSSA